jgi:hypothetical protein
MTRFHRPVSTPRSIRGSPLVQGFSQPTATSISPSPATRAAQAAATMGSTIRSKHQRRCCASSVERLSHHESNRSDVVVIAATSFSS